jgi:hypothetical protein
MHLAHRPHAVADALGTRMADSLNHTLADAIRSGAPRYGVKDEKRVVPLR